MFVATVHVPGYMPMDDDPPVFDTASEAWAYLATERERDEDQDDSPEYTDIVHALRFLAENPDEYGLPLADPTRPPPWAPELCTLAPPATMATTTWAWPTPSPSTPERL